MKKERYLHIAQRKRNLTFFPICCHSRSSESFCFRNMNLLCRRNDWSSQEVPKGQWLHLARNRFPPRLHFPCSSSEDFLSFSATQLCSEQCPSLEKTIQIQVLIFSIPPPPLPPVHMFFNRKVADELLKAKVHPSAITWCFLSSWQKTGSTGSQPPRKSKGLKISHRNVVCHKLQP